MGIDGMVEAMTGASESSASESSAGPSQNPRNNIKKLPIRAAEEEGESQSDETWSQWMNSQRDMWVEDAAPSNNFADLLDSEDSDAGEDVCENGELPEEIF